MKENTERKTIIICAKTLAELAIDMDCHPNTAKRYLKRIGMEEPSNGGNLYSPNEVYDALAKLGYITKIII